VGSYNDAVGSFERSVLPQARKFKELGAEGRKEIPELQELDISTRIVRSVAGDREDVPLIETTETLLLPEPELGVRD